MRWLTLLLTGGLVAVLTMPAAAISFYETWNGPTQWTLLDVDSGTLWTVPVGIGPVSLGTGSPPAPAYPLTKAPGAIADATHASGFEDSWGVFQVVSIYKGYITPGGTIARMTGSGSLLWIEELTDDREIVGTFWGLEDLVIIISSTGAQTIQSKDLELLLYDQKFGTFAAAGGASLGSADRIGTGYDGIGPINSVDGTSVAWMHATSSPGFLGDGTFATEFIGNFDPNVLTPGAPAGSAEFFVDVDPTVGQGGVLYAEGNWHKGVGVEDADLRFVITVSANNPTNKVGGSGIPPAPMFDWTVTTTDDVDGYMVPEPVTMASLFLGIGCLSRYIRKRR